MQRLEASVDGLGQRNDCLCVVPTSILHVLSGCVPTPIKRNIILSGERMVVFINGLLSVPPNPTSDIGAYRGFPIWPVITIPLRPTTTQALALEQLTACGS